MTEILADPITFGHQLVSHYRGLDKLERRHGGREIMDMDLAPAASKLRLPRSSFGSRSQASVRLENDRRALPKVVGMPCADREYFRAQLDSTLAYLQVLEGVKMPFGEFIERTLGAPPIGELMGEIVRQRGVVEDLSRGLGYPFTRDGYSRFVRQEGLSLDEAVEEFHRTEEWSLPILKGVLGLPNGYNFGYQTEFDPVNDYWFNWVSAPRRGGQIYMLLRINTHNRHKRSLVRGNLERMQIHECDGHVVESTLRKEYIRQGRINPAYGICTIPGPQLYNSEGLATALPFWIPKLYQGLSEQGRFAVQRAFLYELVWAVAHQALNSPGADVEQQRKFVEDYYPATTRERIESEVSSRLRSPWHRSYLYVYGLGGYDHSRFAKDLPEGKREVLLREFYIGPPMTPGQTRDRFTQLKEAA